MPRNALKLKSVGGRWVFRALVAVCLLSTAFSLGAQVPQDAPVAAPGLQIPGTAVPYALDQYHGKRELVPIHHSTVGVDQHRGRNFVGGLTESFFYRPKMTTELDGEHARVSLHSSKPIFYLHDADDPDHSGDGKDSLTSTWAILHLKIHKDHRQVTKITVNSFGGHAKKKAGIIDATVERLPGGWIRITPLASLEPGEYALCPVLNNPAFFTAVVYDFAVDPNAPEAKEAITAKQ